MHYGAVGPDGSDLIDYLIEHHVNASSVLRLDDASGHAFIQVDTNGQNAIVIHGGSNRLLPESYWHDAIDSMETGDWLLLQNETNAIADMIERAHQKGANIAINVAPADPSVRTLPIEKTNLLIVNEAEACLLAGKDDADAALATLCTQLKDTDVVMTLGKDGLRMCSGPDRTQSSVTAYEVTAIDETAAGDAFVGYVMAELVAGASLDVATRRGSAAGALAVTKAGAAPSIPSADEVDDLLR